MTDPTGDIGLFPGTAAPDDFDDVASTRERLAEAGYLADDRLATTVFLLTRIGRPVLLEGPAGVGKTQLAQTLASVTGRRLLRLQCYEGQDESKALYEWDYGKQLLYTQLLRDKIGEIVSDTATIAEAVEAIGEQDAVFFSETFLASRPLLEAVRSPEPVVLLVDEIDRADEALEAVLLEMLAESQVSVPEIGTFRAVHQPYVVLTSNNTRDLSAALKRRCLHLFIDYPEPARELDIIRSKKTGLPDALASQLVEVVRQLRELELRKAPSISETIDWARTLAVLGVEELTAQVLSDTANVVLKYERDLRTALTQFPRMLDPNTVVPAAGHGHGHGHGHDGDHDHDSVGPGGPGRGSALGAEGDHGVVDLSDGAAVRAAKDTPGRHDAAYYGSSQGARSATPPSQGSRSFAPARPKSPTATPRPRPKRG